MSILKAISPLIFFLLMHHMGDLLQDNGITTRTSFWNKAALKRANNAIQHRSNSINQHFSNKLIYSISKANRSKLLEVARTIHLRN